MDTFLSTLDLSYASSLKFDCRPGLKFLLQKVTNLEQPANLYRQASSAWTIKILTLFELTSNEIETTQANVNTIKTILKRQSGTIKKHTKLFKYLKELQVTFNELCETYVDIVLDRDGIYTKVDNFSERKIFLLIAQPENYPEIVKKEPIDDTRIINHLEDEEPDNYGVEYSTDSGPESEPDSWIDQKFYSRRRKSDGCLTPTFKHNEEEFHQEKFNTIAFRSRSAMELRKLRDVFEYSKSPGCGDDHRKEIEENDHIVDDMDELIKDYEHSKRGFRTNPFLKNEQQPKRETIDDHDSKYSKKSHNVKKDSEARRKIWAEILSVSLEWSLALSVMLFFLSYAHEGKRVRTIAIT